MSGLRIHTESRRAPSYTLNPLAIQKISVNMVTFLKLLKPQSTDMVFPKHPINHPLQKISNQLQLIIHILKQYRPLIK